MTSSEAGFGCWLRIRRMSPAGNTSRATKRRNPPQPEPYTDIKQRMAHRKGHAFSRPFRLSVRQLAIAGAVFFAVSLLLWMKGPRYGLSHSTPSEDVDWDFRRDEVKQAFVTSGMPTKNTHGVSSCNSIWFTELSHERLALLVSRTSANISFL